MLCCFNLLESFFNGLAWEFCQDPQNLSKLSNTQKNLISDGNQASFKDKIFKYPKIISKKEISDNDMKRISGWIEYFKPYRDSLTHPSPFNAPEKFGGYDKLKNLYSMDSLLAFGAATITCEICEIIYTHIYGETTILPSWLSEFGKNIEKILSEQY